MKRLFVSATLLCFFILGTLSLATGEDNPSSFVQGKQYFDQGQYDAAYKAFFKAFRQDPANLEINFYLGRAAFESGRLEEAVMAYDRILIMDPEAIRIKLELARAHLRLGSKELARQFFKEVLATNPPEAVWQNIERFLTAIEKSEKHHFINGIITVGLSHDDNVRVAPISETVNVRTILSDLPVTVDRPQSDAVFSTTAVVNHIYTFSDSPYAWKSTAVNYNALYDSFADLDVNFLSLNSGLTRQSEKYLWELYGTVNYMDLEHDRYLGSFGLGSTVTTLINKMALFTASASVQQKNFYRQTDSERDANNFMVSAGPTLTVGLNRFSATAAKEWEHAETDYNSYDRFTIEFRYDRQFPYDLNGFALFRLQDTEYDEPDLAISTIARSDTLRDISIGLSKTLWQAQDKRYTLSGQVSYTDTAAGSNIALYEYEKEVFAGSLTFAF